jgi:hypothetical protein
MLHPHEIMKKSEPVRFRVKEQGTSDDFGAFALELQRLIKN